MLGDQNVFKDGQGPEQPDILEGTGNAPVGDPVGGGVQLVGVEPLVLAQIGFVHLALGIVLHQGLAAEVDFAVGGLVHTGDAVEGGGFAGAVGADQGHDFPLVDIHGQVVHGHHAAKLHGHMFHMEDVWTFTHFDASFSACLGLDVLRLRSRSGSSRSPIMPRRKNSTTIMMMTENTTIRKPLRSRGSLRDREITK